MPWDRSNGLRSHWSKKERDFVVEFPNKPDGHLLNYYLYTLKPPPSPLRPGETTMTLAEELEARGYDLTTLKFSIKKKESKT